jgi:hypothetical protein
MELVSLVMMRHVTCNTVECYDIMRHVTCSTVECYDMMRHVTCSTVEPLWST